MSLDAPVTFGSVINARILTGKTGKIDFGKWPTGPTKGKAGSVAMEHEPQRRPEPRPSPPHFYFVPYYTC